MMLKGASRMWRAGLAAVAVLVAGQAFTAYRAGTGEQRQGEQRQGERAVAAAVSAAAINPARTQFPDEDVFYQEAAEVAWRHFDQALWQPNTGLANATPFYDRLTPWDIASVIATLYSAHRLDLISQAEYEKRMGTTLRTLEKIPLFRNAVFHKKYSAKNARMIGRNNAVTASGYGWSATDLGRLLVWLHIVAENDEQFSKLARRIGERVRFKETTAAGYMYGGLNGTRGKLWKFQEGRIGYEQYAAQGYAWFGAEVANALDLNRNAVPAEVLDVPILADKRGLDRLNSEPFILAGIEFGWTPDMKQLALNVLAAQEARFQKTGILTAVSEDALDIKPHYFYYYCVYCNGKTFVIDVAEPGKALDGPRWISTKAAFGWHSLVGSEYTRALLQEISKARTEDAWSSGVFEKSGAPTRAFNVNTTAVILEAALYRKLRRPLLYASNPPL